MKSYCENSGSCINFELAVIEFQLNLGGSASGTRNIFENSYSNTTGGAILYIFYKPSGINLNSFINNSAYQYPSDISSPPQKLLIVSREFYQVNINSNGNSKNVSIGNSLHGNTISNHRSGRIIDEFYIGIFNEFDTLDKSITDTDLIDSIYHKKGDEYLSSINKASVFVSQNGLFNITNPEVIATSNSVQTINFLTNAIDSTIPSNIVYYASMNQTNFWLLVTVNVRKCISDEEFKNNVNYLSENQENTSSIFLPNKPHLTNVSYPLQTEQKEIRFTHFQDIGDFQILQIIFSNDSKHLHKRNTQ